MLIDNTKHQIQRENWVKSIKKEKENRVIRFNDLCEQTIRELGSGIILGSQDIRILHKYKQKAFLTMSIMWCALRSIPKTRTDYNTAIDWEFGTAKSKRKEYEENVWHEVSDALHNEEFWSADDIKNAPKEILLNNEMKKEFILLFEELPDIQTSKELMNRFWKFYKDTSCYTKHNVHKDEIFWYV